MTKETKIWVRTGKPVTHRGARQWEDEKGLHHLPGEPDCKKCRGEGSYPVRMKVNDDDYRRWAMDARKQHGIIYPINEGEKFHCPEDKRSHLWAYEMRMYRYPHKECNCFAERRMREWMTPRVYDVASVPVTARSHESSYVIGDWLPVLKAALAAEETTIRWRHFTDAQLISRRLDGVEDEETGKMIKRYEVFEKDDLVVIEIGTQGANTRAATYLYEFLDGRTKAGLPTWIVAERPLRRGDPMFNKDVERLLDGLKRHGDQTSENAPETINRQDDAMTDEVADLLALWNSQFEEEA